MSADETTTSTAIDADQQRLHELGYAQELRRHMSGFSNFAVSFTIISILSGCLTLYGYGMKTGGPVLIVGDRRWHCGFFSRHGGLPASGLRGTMPPT